MFIHCFHQINSCYFYLCLFQPSVNYFWLLLHILPLKLSHPSNLCLHLLQVHDCTDPLDSSLSSVHHYQKWYLPGFSDVLFKRLQNDNLMKVFATVSSSGRWSYSPVCLTGKCFVIFLATPVSRGVQYCTHVNPSMNKTMTILPEKSGASITIRN